MHRKPLVGIFIDGRQLEVILHYLRLAWNYRRSSHLSKKEIIYLPLGSTQIHNRQNLHGDTGVTPHGIYMTTKPQQHPTPAPMHNEQKNNSIRPGYRSCL
ncbi:hypothetical protein WUBG_01172 [Wuchereria bancrofti]|uniref:Uncharacterized protein n=1 Tax=Wuchereria bancrofti TaxID=6293 RepID=J9FKM0_WUCBA|nr:hypothetical protein WUBG_01172 [Wuchereria bancrofti]